MSKLLSPCWLGQAPPWCCRSCVGAALAAHSRSALASGNDGELPTLAGLPEWVTEIGMNRGIHFLLYPTNLCIPYQIKRRKIKYCLKHFF